jgi:hypothetical protein
MEEMIPLKVRSGGFAHPSGIFPSPPGRGLAPSSSLRCSSCGGLKSMPLQRWARAIVLRSPRFASFRIHQAVESMVVMSDGVQGYIAQVLAEKHREIPDYQV